MSYYAMYDVLLALLFRVGIKCENHSGSISLLELIFEKKDLSQLILNAKKERIDKEKFAKYSLRSDYCQVRIWIVSSKEKIPIGIPFFLD